MCMIERAARVISSIFMIIYSSTKSETVSKDSEREIEIERGDSFYFVVVLVQFYSCNISYFISFI